MNVRDVTIDQTMTRLLEGMELTYKKEQENVIVLIRKTQSKQLTKKVTGTVVDANGEPIIGASIVIKGESHGTITDFEADGRIREEFLSEKSIYISIYKRNWYQRANIDIEVPIGYHIMIVKGTGFTGCEAVSDRLEREFYAE